MDKRVVIAVAGGSGSGKSTLVRQLSDMFGAAVAVLRQDDYYKPHSGLSFDERKALNYDSPDAFDTELLESHISALKNGEGVDVPIYDFARHDRSGLTHRVEPADVLIVDGIYLLADERLRSLSDLRVFIDADADMRLIRRIKRDVNERGRDLDGIIEQYVATVKPMHEAHIEPSRKFADVIVPMGGCNAAAVDMISKYISRCLSH